MTGYRAAAFILEAMRRNTLYALILLLAAIAIAGTLGVLHLYALAR